MPNLARKNITKPHADRYVVPVEPRFASAYPNLIAACRAQGIKTIPQLWRKYCEAAHELYLNQFLSLERYERLTNEIHYSMFVLLIQGKRNDNTTFVSPWDGSDGIYKQQAVMVGKALGRHPRYLFGASADLSSQLSKVGDNPTPQKIHIRALMSRAIHPITGKKGLTSKDIHALATTPELKNKFLTRYFQDQSGSYQTPWSFDLETGEATLWAQDFAAILNMPVDEVFKYEAMQLAERHRPSSAFVDELIQNNNLGGHYDLVGAQSDAWQPEELDALEDKDPLQEGMQDVSRGREGRQAQRPDLIVEDYVPLKAAVSRALSTLRDWRIERLLRLRFGVGSGEGLTLEQVAEVMLHIARDAPRAYTRERIRQLEAKGLCLLRYFDEHHTFDPENIDRRKAEYEKKLASYEKTEWSLLSDQRALLKMEQRRPHNDKLLEKIIRDLKSLHADRPEKGRHRLLPYYVQLKPYHSAL